MFQDFGIDVPAIVGGFLPRLLAALAILVVGWLVALVVASVVRRVLNRTSFDNRLAAWIAGDRGRSLPIERAAGTTAFWLVMLFVFMGVFQTLQLTVVTEPLNALLGQMAAFTPRLFGAVLLALLAGVVATAGRRIVTHALALAHADERLGDQAAGPPVSRTLGEATFWLVWLLFLPAILSTLELTGLLEPVQALLNKAMAFLPNLFAAVLVLLVGWFVATLVRRVVTNLLAALGLDRAGDRAGVSASLGGNTLSGAVGTVVYVLVLLPVGIAALNALQIDAVTQPASNMLDALLAAVPRLFAAAIVLGLAWFVGRVVADLVSRTLSAIGFDNLFVTLGLTGASTGAGSDRARRSPSDVAGGVALVALILFAAVEAAGLLEFVALQAMLSSFIVLAGRVLLGLAILGIGLYLAGLAARVIRSSGLANAVLLATTARIAVLVLVGAMALRQMGLANEIINLAFGLTVGALAVAAAIAFGIGGRDIAARELDAWVRQIKGRS